MRIFSREDRSVKQNKRSRKTKKEMLMQNKTTKCEKEVIILKQNSKQKDENSKINLAS